MDKLPLLPGVPEGRVRAILQKAGGNEIASGKFASPQSSAALAVNGFGWFLDRPADLPPFPGLEDCDWPAIRVDVELGQVDARHTVLLRKKRNQLISPLQ